MDIISPGSTIIQHYHHQREKFPGDGQEGPTALLAELACPQMVVSPPLAMKPQYKVYCNYIIVWNSVFFTAASEQNYLLFYESFLKEIIFFIKIYEQLYKNTSLRFFQALLQ